MLAWDLDFFWLPWTRTFIFPELHNPGINGQVLMHAKMKILEIWRFSTFQFRTAVEFHGIDEWKAFHNELELLNQKVLCPVQRILKRTEDCTLVNRMHITYSSQQSPDKVWQGGTIFSFYSSCTMWGSAAVFPSNCLPRVVHAALVDKEDTKKTI